MGQPRPVGRVTPSSSPHTIPEEWGRADVLVAQPGLRLIPGTSADVVIAGEYRLLAEAPGKPLIEDSYSLELQIPRTYPSRGFVLVFEKAGRIPSDYHKLKDGSLCLGSPTRLRAISLRSPRIGDFIERAVVPYLYGRSYFERFGTMPFGELLHGGAGLARDFVALFRLPLGADVQQLLAVASMRRRHANKRSCPCASGRRLGRCHNARVNAVRAQFGRRWFAEQEMLLFGRRRRRPRAHRR